MADDLEHLWFGERLREWLGQTEGDLHILSEHTYDVYLLIFFISLHQSCKLYKSLTT